MSTLHEQARAEAEKRLPDIDVDLVRDMAHNVQAARLRKSFVEGAVWAATKPEQHRQGCIDDQIEKGD